MGENCGCTIKDGKWDKVCQIHQDYTQAQQQISELQTTVRRYRDLLAKIDKTFQESTFEYEMALAMRDGLAAEIQEALTESSHTTQEKG